MEYINDLVKIKTLTDNFNDEKSKVQTINILRDLELAKLKHPFEHLPKVPSIKDMVGPGFKPHRRHGVVSLSKNINPSLVLVQPRKTRPFITERLLLGCKESNQTE